MTAPQARSIASFWALGLLVIGVSFRACSPDGPAGSGLPHLPADGIPLAQQPYRFEVGSHCGVGSLGLPVDGRRWITDEANGQRDWIPAEWAATQDVGAGLITLTVQLSADRAHLTAELAERTVVYRPQTADDPVVFCA